MSIELDNIRLQKDRCVVPSIYMYVNLHRPVQVQGARTHYWLANYTFPSFWTPFSVVNTSFGYFWVTFSPMEGLDLLPPVFQN